MSENVKKVFTRGVDPGAVTRRFRVDIPGTEYYVFLKELSVDEMAAMTPETTLTEQVSLMLVDENGTRLFTTDEEKKELGRMSQSVMVYLLREALARNGLSGEAFEAMLKNSEAGRNADSATG